MKISRMAAVFMGMALLILNLTADAKEAKFKYDEVGY